MRTQAQHLRVARAGFLALILGLAWTSPVHAAITYSGRAFAAFLNVGLPGIAPTTLSDTGELPDSGGFKSAELVSVDVPGVLRAELLVAKTSGANGVAESFASLAEVNVLNGLVTASAVRAESEATCNGVRGSTEIAGLTFGGLPITVEGSIKQVVGPIEVPGVGTATLIINEQIQNSGQGFREITVNAVHLTVEGAVPAEVILSHAHSDIKGCPGCPPTPACHDFVSGGGWITVGKGRANFGFNVGFKAGSSEPEIHFNYIDHNTGVHMKAISITEYVATGPTSRSFKGSAEINGVPGDTYDIEVSDIGEPGRNTDTISIRFGNGYSAGGRLAGGNIQLHKPCP